MSQADELLNSLTETGTDVVDGNIVIGTDRVITVPESLKKIGVQYDHNVNTVTFDCPRYWDGRDLSTMKLYANYMRSDGQLGSQLCNNIVTGSDDDEIMHFDWVISGNVTQVNGPLVFLVCAKKTDKDGNEVTHWNSELNTDMYVSPGLKCQDTIVRRYPDIITSLLTRMDEIETALGVLDTYEVMEAVDDIRTFVDANPLITTVTDERIDSWDSKTRIYISSDKPSTAVDGDMWFELAEDGVGGTWHRIMADNADAVLYPITTADRIIGFKDATSGKATTLETERSVLVNLGSASAEKFDGSKDINPGVSGVLPVANGGTGGTTPAAARSSIGAMSSSGGTMSGNLTLSKASYTGLLIKDTTIGSLAKVMNGGHTAIVSMHNSGDDTNQRQLIIRDRTNRAELTEAMQLGDVIDGVYKYYNILHTGNLSSVRSTLEDLLHVKIEDVLAAYDCVGNTTNASSALTTTIKTSLATAKKSTVGDSVTMTVDTSGLGDTRAIAEINSAYFNITWNEGPLSLGTPEWDFYIVLNGVSHLIDANMGKTTDDTRYFVGDVNVAKLIGKTIRNTDTLQIKAVCSKAGGYLYPNGTVTWAPMAFTTL